MMKEAQPGPDNSRTTNISIQLEKEQPAQIQGTRDKGRTLSVFVILHSPQMLEFVIVVNLLLC